MAEVAQVVDYSFQHPDPSVIRTAGYAGAMRYLGPANTRLTASERDALLAAGLSIGVVFETSANRAGQGFDAGVQDANTANDQADALGLGDVVIYYAVDFDATVAQVLPYFQGVASVKRRRFGPYGSLRVVDGILAAGIGAVMAWQTVAWSHGQLSVDPRVVLYQRETPTKGPIPGTDENACLAGDWGQWPRPNQPPQPPPEDDDMRKFRLIQGDGPAPAGDRWLLVSDDYSTRIHATTPDVATEMVFDLRAQGHQVEARESPPGHFVPLAAKWTQARVDALLDGR